MLKAIQCQHEIHLSWEHNGYRPVPLLCPDCEREGNKPPRTITPHKGGRTVKKSLDVTPETNAKIKALKSQGVSLGDLVKWAVNNYKL